MLKRQWLIRLSALLLAAVGLTANASEALRLQKVRDHVYAVVGPFGNRTPENLGNNATFGFVVTEEGVMLIDSGGTYRGAATIEAVIRQVTDKPVKVVINSGGQDHRWLGNGYFKERGARIIANQAAVEDQKTRTQDQLFMLGNLVGAEGLKGTETVYADETFEKTKHFTLGGVTFELHHVGPAHTPGDTLVWMPNERIVFAGDVVFVGRMLGILPHSSSRDWIEAFDAMAALEPETVIPGHGPATDLASARKDTRDYLSFLHESVGTFMDEGGDNKSCDGKLIQILIPAQLGRHSGRKTILSPTGQPVNPDCNEEADVTLLNALIRAHRWSRWLARSKHESGKDLAADEGITSPSYASRILRLTLLAPDIQEAILDSTHPATLTLADFMDPFPQIWELQRKQYGF